MVVVIPPFNGPIKDLDINQWLSGAEDVFENAFDDTGKEVSDKQKVHATGMSIAKSPPTDKLYAWWTEERNKLEMMSWDTFQDAIKDKALGSGWRVRALKALYVTTQDGRSLEDYFAALDSIKFILSRTSKISPISEVEFKSHLLFRATPAITSQALKNDIRDALFINATVDEIKDYLRKYEAGNQGTSSDIPVATNMNEMASFGMFILSEAWGFDQGTSFNDMGTGFPTTSTQLKHLSRITVWFNNDASFPSIQGYDTVFSGGPTIRNPPTINTPTTSQTLDFASGEFITQVQISRRADLLGICSMEITSSKGRLLPIGVSSAEKKTFRAPYGWRIVGFYGTANLYTAVSGTWRYPTPKLGVIYAPVIV